MSCSLDSTRARRILPKDLTVMLSRLRHALPSLQTLRIRRRAARTIHRLPPEIIDYIISFLSDDKRSLCRCALTCRGWLTSSRFHLFNYLQIRGHETLDLFEHALEAPHLAPFFTVTSYLHLDPSYPRDSPYGVRALWPATHILPIMLGRRVVALDSFFLRKFATRHATLLHPDLLWKAPLQMTALATLWLENCMFSRLPQFGQFLRSFPYLFELTLVNVRIDYGPYISPIDAGAKPHLHRLNIFENVDWLISEWFLHPSGPEIEELCVDFDRWQADHQGKPPARIRSPVELPRNYLRLISHLASIRNK
ncbi:hypothetical protein B0H21DRAFT_504688 [Amylocystis lapponica]|nr:hypothetical protein B0H21DRAFT_504688 [Amylocystis lapponica]